MKYVIEQDQGAENPRTSWDQFGTILYTSSHYVLGDKQVRDEFYMQEICDDPQNVVFPVYAYIHGSVALSMSSFSCAWDSGQCGVIYVTREKIREMYGCKRITKRTLARVEALLRSEIETFSAYLSGEVYGYRILDDDDNEVDSCWGFYGYKHVEDDAKAALAACEKDAKRKANERRAEERAIRSALRASNKAFQS